MISIAHTEAARRNGAKSNGPRTSAGKAASSRNSCQHGMTAKAVVLTNENPQAFINLAESYHAKFEPTDDVERDIIDDMTVSRWRLRRVWQNEKALFDLELDRQSKKIAAQYDKIGHNSCSALAFRALADESKALQLLNRYETTHRRSYYKALATLVQLRAGLQPNPGPVDPTAEPPTEPEPEQDTSNNSEPIENNLYETNPANTEPASNNHEPATQNPRSDEKTPSSDPQGGAN